MALDKRNEKPIIGSIINPTSARPSCRAFSFRGVAQIRESGGYPGGRLGSSSLRHQARPDKPGVSEGVFPSFSADNPGSAGLPATALQSHVPMPVSGLIR